MTQNDKALTLLTVAEVADMMRVSRTTIWRWCDAGKLSAFQAGRNWRIYPDSVEQLMGGGKLQQTKGGTVEIMG